MAACAAACMFPPVGSAGTLPVQRSFTQVHTRPASTHVHTRPASTHVHTRPASTHACAHLWRRGGFNPARRQVHDVVQDPDGTDGRATIQRALRERPPPACSQLTWHLAQLQAVAGSVVMAECGGPHTRRARARARNHDGQAHGVRQLRGVGAGREVQRERAAAGRAQVVAAQARLGGAARAIRC
eukprot:352825-Chlamydomonas_euryale.AAC.6